MPKITAIIPPLAPGIIDMMPTRPPTRKSFTDRFSMRGPHTPCIKTVAEGHAGMTPFPEGMSYFLTVTSISITDMTAVSTVYHERISSTE